MIRLCLFLVIVGCAAKESGPKSGPREFYTFKEQEKFGVVDEAGNEILPARYRDIKIGPGGLLAISTDTYRWGVIDAAGKLLIDTVYEQVDVVRDGYVRVMKETYYGALNGSGQWVVPPRYGSLAYLGMDRWAFYRQEGSKRMEGLIQPNGNEVVIENGWAIGHFESGVASLGSRLVDTTGRVSELDSILVVGCYWNGAFCARPLHDPESRVGYVDREGRWLIRPRFVEAMSFMSSGLAWVKEESLWGLVDREGQYALSPQFTEIIHDDEAEVTWVRRKGEIQAAGLLDELIPPSEEDINSALSTIGTWGLLDRHGEVIRHNDLAAVHAFYKGTAWVNEGGWYDAYLLNSRLGVKLVGGQWGLIDTSGGYVLKPQYDSVTTSDPLTGEPPGIAAAFKKDRMWNINYRGTILQGRAQYFDASRLARWVALGQMRELPDRGHGL